MVRGLNAEIDMLLLLLLYTVVGCGYVVVVVHMLR